MSRQKRRRGALHRQCGHGLHGGLGKPSGTTAAAEVFGPLVAAQYVLRELPKPVDVPVGFELFALKQPEHEKKRTLDWEHARRTQWPQHVEPNGLVT